MLITLDRPDDWHIHLRDGELLKLSVPDAARQFARALVMPNLSPPLCDSKAIIAYKQRITQHVPKNLEFTPLMTLYLQDGTTPQIIKAARDHILAAKLYPAHATTASALGVKSIKNIYQSLAAMEQYGLTLCIHGELMSPEIDIFDREAAFIEHELIPLTRDFPGLRIVLEHITTRDAVSFIRETKHPIAATITAHHLLSDRNALFHGSYLRPHYYCLPIPKRSAHREALLNAACSGNPRFFIGSDSAPHDRTLKESACACAGCYTAYAALELYAEAFAQRDALDKLEGFCSHFGADFYGLPRNQKKIQLRAETWCPPAELSPIGASEKICVVPWRNETPLQWRLKT